MEQFGSSCLSFRGRLLPLEVRLCQMKLCRHCIDGKNEHLTDHTKEPVTTRLTLGFES
jgi:hypothetical protein